jgi:hypothetical protein
LSYQNNQKYAEAGAAMSVAAAEYVAQPPTAGEDVLSVKFEHPVFEFLGK